MMPLKGKVLFGISLSVLEKVISDLKTDARMNELFGGKVLEHTALVASDEEYGIFALDTGGLSVAQEKEFTEILKPILKKHMSAAAK